MDTTNDVDTFAPSCLANTAIQASSLMFRQYSVTRMQIWDYAQKMPSSQKLIGKVLHIFSRT